MISSTERFEAAAKDPQGDWVLRLYTVGATPAAQRAISNLRQLCEQELQGRYTLEVIDLREHPGLAEQEQIIALPTLIKALPAPVARVVGDLSNREKVLVGLDLQPRAR
ncbi:MAG: circadian clock KaiB family protein [Solirubrobacteraceae bacterium]|jgi:circadian clock protein KaiB